MSEPKSRPPYGIANHKTQAFLALQRGFRRTLPFVLGVTPFGIAYGAAAAQTMHWSQGLGMSALVFAGTAQFIAVGLLSQGAPLLSVIVTTLVVNLRFVLLTAALSPQLLKERRRWQAVMAFFVVDESFAVSSVGFKQGESSFFLLGTGLALWLIWLLSGAAGIWLGPLIPAGYGLEFALPASLIGLLALLVRTRLAMLTALIAAVLCLALYFVLPGTWPSLVGALVATTIVVIWEQSKCGR
jgi:4-azaleucine resistance transporter AzlC